MKLTRAGRGLALMAALTLAAAVSSGNNLLYLLYSAGIAALALSWIAGRLNLGSLDIEIALPDQIFRESEFPLTIRLRKRGVLPSSLLQARWGSSIQRIERLKPGEQTEVSLRLRTDLRGINRIDDIWLESLYPFGLLSMSKKLPPAMVTVYPGLHEIRSAQDVTSQTEIGGELGLRKGQGDEFFGVREYAVTDDIRWINWKLTAKAGRALITEFAEPVGSKITVRLMSSGRGSNGELQIEEAASACRYFIDSGAEVRLVTAEGEGNYGRGLLHLDGLLRTLALVGDGKTVRDCKAPGKLQAGLLGDPVSMRRLAWIGSVIIYASMFLIDDIQPWILTVLGPIVAISLLLQERDGPWLPKPLWDALSLATLGYVTLMDWHFSGIIVTNTHLVLYLMSNRLLNPLKGDALGQIFIILFLAFFLVSGQTISLWYFLAFLLFTAFAIVWLIVGSGVKSAHWRQWVPTISASWFVTLGLTAICFALTPRFDTWYQRNAFAAVMGLDKLRTQAGAVAGFTENVSLGFFGQLKASGARVMRVKPATGEPRLAPELYLRGAAFDSFDGRRWTKTAVDFHFHNGRFTHHSVNGHAWLPRANNRIYFPIQTKGNLSSVEFTILPINTAIVFTAGAPEIIDGMQGTVMYDATDSLYSSSAHFNGIRYTTRSMNRISSFGSTIDHYPHIVHDLFLQVPASLDPKTRELAKQIAAGVRDDIGKAQAIQNYLRKNYRYSTFSKVRSASLDQFLYNTKSGNCEYFATAEAILLRLNGIPSRLVAGFLASNWNEYGQFYDVRESEAHAWVEAYMHGQWIRIDPTPPEDFSFRDNVLDRASKIYNALQARWYEHVIGYDSYVQRNSFYRLGLTTAREALAKIVRWALYLASMIGIGFVLLNLLTWWKRYLRLPRSPYFKAQAALERAGFKRQIHWTPKEFAREVAGARPALQAIEELADWHYQERYAGLKLTPEQQAQTQELLDRILKQL